MCSLFGALINVNDTAACIKTMQRIFRDAFSRGRDGYGWSFIDNRTGFISYHSIDRFNPDEFGNYESPEKPIEEGRKDITLIGNTRAEPTTEYVKGKLYDDQQPYELDGWSIVHNGTIANDKEIRSGRLPTKIDSAAVAEVLAETGPKIKYGSIPNGIETFYQTFVPAIQKLKGSYAILAVNQNLPGHMYACTNYRPLWYIKTPSGFFFASSRSAFKDSDYPKMLRPYSAALFRTIQNDAIIKTDIRPAENHGRKPKALVVCSGGLDSTVSAAFAQSQGYDIELVHFLYGSRAEGPEVKAVKKIADYLGTHVNFIKVGIYDPADSPLLNAASKIAGGEEGAEFAYEWVPARNLVMLSMATAFAEAKGFKAIVLGNNLEEAGAYPDNEPEFIARFNDLLPFAVGDGKRVSVIMPVGNMMKHEIVRLGHEIGAPMHLTWSCYRAGDKHCGTCGPCFMRRTAFEINGLPEVIQYEKD